VGAAEHSFDKLLRMHPPSHLPRSNRTILMRWFSAVGPKCFAELILEYSQGLSTDWPPRSATCFARPMSPLRIFRHPESAPACGAKFSLGQLPPLGQTHLHLCSTSIVSIGKTLAGHERLGGDPPGERGILQTNAGLRTTGSGNGPKGAAFPRAGWAGPSRNCGSPLPLRFGFGQDGTMGKIP